MPPLRSINRDGIERCEGSLADEYYPIKRVTFYIWFGVLSTMWRALFYAIGSMTILLGVQSLAFEQVQLAPGKGVLQIVKRLLREDGGSSVAVASGNANAIGNQNITNRGGRSLAGSSFGSSRFPNGGFGGTTFSAAPYRDLTQNGGLGIRSGQSTSVPQVDLASYQTGTQQANANNVLAKPGRVIRSQDWMPWSLLAIGSVVMLYTRSFGARSA